jgi:hypothetical protein
MPRNQYRIPRTQGKFDSYVKITSAYLNEGSPVPNWQRLGLTADEKNLWKNLGGLWIARFNEYNNAGTRTPVVIQQKNEVKKQFIDHAAPLLTRMAGSAALTEADRLVFHLPHPDRILTLRSAIRDAPDPMLISLSGGFIKMKVHVKNKEGRASRHPMADGVEVKYVLGNTPPQTPNDCPNYFISTKALFIMQLGIAAQGQRIYCFFRWVNLANPAHNSPWSSMLQTVVA